MKRRKLLIADDSEMNRAILANMLEQDFDIIEASDGRETIAALQNYREEISALLLDVVMPGMNGFEVLEKMKKLRLTEEIPTVMISAETGNRYIDRAFELGASDYISRPFAPGIIRHRVINAILLHTKKHQLMNLVESRIYGREKHNEALVSILDYAVERRSGGEGMHMSGVSMLTSVLLNRLVKKTDSYEIESADIEIISAAAALHDIGKLFIPADILNKPGKLTEEEYEIVKDHTKIGADIILQTPIHQGDKFVKYAAAICRWHHERWNGEGYPDGLKGDNIPIAAQVVSIADVYDALINKRSYKDAYSHEKAMTMIKNGECGSFNPLLLECLDDLGDYIKQKVETNKDKKNRENIQRITDEIYNGRDMNAARITQQLEDANTKRDFMINLSDEMWFEYTAAPASITLSKGASEQTGLPQLIAEPTKNTVFCDIVGENNIKQITERLKKIPADESFTEIEITIMLKGKYCRCKIAILILRSMAESAEYEALLGKIVNIDESYNRLEDFDDMLSDEADEQVLLPVTISGENILKITHDQVGKVIRSFRTVYEKVRLVDPGICMQVTLEETDHYIEESGHCYSIWGKTRRCEHCISQDAIRTRRTQSKVEAVGNNVFYILAVCIDIDGMPYAMECINSIRLTNKNNLEEENILNQLLLRNRQVYMDSTTKIFNRRYYDVRIRNITGEHALAMIDIDNFKQINDTFGHVAGDEALYRIVHTIRSNLRSNDELIRYGGDEFFLLFHGLPQQVLEKKLNEICKSVRELDFKDYPEMKLTLSIGGIYSSGRVSDLIKKADAALYKAKIKKDCAVVFKEDENESK